MSELDARGDAIAIVGPVDPGAVGLERPADRHRWTAPLGSPDDQRVGPGSTLQAARDRRPRRGRRYRRSRPPVGPAASPSTRSQPRRGSSPRRSGRATTSLGSSGSGSAILLTETTEIAAINFVERARAACERDLQVATEVVNVAFGWASPPKGGDLTDAMGLAAEAARRRAGGARPLGPEDLVEVDAPEALPDTRIATNRRTDRTPHPRCQPRVPRLASASAPIGAASIPLMSLSARTKNWSRRRRDHRHGRGRASIVDGSSDLASSEQSS